MAVTVKADFSCALPTISASTREVSLDSRRRDSRASSSSFMLRAFLVTVRLVNLLVSFGASGMVETRSPTW